MTLNNLLNAQHKPHAIIFCESKLCLLDVFIKDYMKSIIKINDNPLWKTKIDQDNYFDVIKIDGYKNNIKKEQILNISEQFSQSAVESCGIKFYIIKGIENANQQAINSLLKFLEEPPPNTFAILTTRNINMILATVRSRCQVYIVPSNETEVIKLLEKFNLDEIQIKVIKDVYYDVNEIIEHLKSKLFYKSYSFVQELIVQYQDLVAIKKLSEQFRKMDYQQIGLVLRMINSLIPNNEALFELIRNVNFNPTKILLFNHIWKALEAR